MTFCASMADVFEDHPQVAGPRARLWALSRRRPGWPGSPAIAAPVPLIASVMRHGRPAG